MQPTLLIAQENQDLLGRSDMVINHLRVTAPKDWPYTCNMAALDFYTRALGTPDYGYVTVLREPVDRWGRGGDARGDWRGLGVVGPGGRRKTMDLTVCVTVVAAVWAVGKWELGGI